MPLQSLHIKCTSEAAWHQLLSGKKQTARLRRGYGEASANLKFENLKRKPRRERDSPAEAYGASRPSLYARCGEAFSSNEMSWLAAGGAPGPRPITISRAGTFSP